MDQSMESRGLVRLAIAGLLALAAAMGIGRFAATPLLPLMQQGQGLSLAQGAWMASANYAGYLAGALLALVAAPGASRAVRWGLVAVMVVTAAMALTDSVPVWYLLRFVAGVASALVLVGVSGTALSIIGASAQPALTGLVFAGVGLGSAVAGLIAMAAAAAGLGAPVAWLLLAAAVVGVLARCRAAWPAVSASVASTASTASAATPISATDAPRPADASTPAGRPGLDPGAWTLIVAYGVFGLGYIVPATFLPAMARELFADPLVYGWLWPLFGLAAGVSTVLTTYRFRGASPRTLFVASLVVMAVGVVAPVLDRSAPSLVLSALCVGGTFMVATMAGLWQARLIVDGPPFRLIAAMTAAFATGQLCGPALVALGAGRADPIALPSVVSGVLLLGSAALVRYTVDRR